MSFVLIWLHSEPPFVLADVFPKWLSQVAFSPSGLVMKHALDVAVMLDTIAHDENLGMKELIPVMIIISLIYLRSSSFPI
jgi:hypothetical protein